MPSLLKKKKEKNGEKEAPRHQARTEYYSPENQLDSQSRNCGVKYETTMVAPALNIPSVLSNAMVFRSNTPALAPAWIMANSPLTWYAATGMFLPMSLASLMMSRYELAGLTMMISAPSWMSRWMARRAKPRPPGGSW